MFEYTVSFERPWVFALLLVAGFFVFFPYFRMPKNKRRTIGRVVSLVARTISILLVTTLLAGLTFTKTNYIPEKTALVIVADYSDSTEEMQEQMRTFAQDLIESADNDTRIASIIFANEAYSAGEFTSNHEEALSDFIYADERELTKDATNIQEALFAASEMFDTDDNLERRRVVLLSDGRQTSGNAWEAANVLLNKGIRLDAVSFDITGRSMAEVSMRDFSVSPSQIVDQGKNITLMVTIESTMDTEGSIRFFNGDERLVSFTTTIDKGAQIFTRTISADELGDVGLHELRVEVHPEDDSLEPNNTLHTWVKINDIPSVLIVDGDGSQSAKLEEQIKGVYHVDVVRAEEFPETMEELLIYDEIVLMNVNTNRLPANADQLIDRFVKDLGRGLLTTTGSTLDSYDSYTGTLLEDMLPVTMTLDDTENNIAMVIVIDDSGSMVQGVDKFTPALEGVKICIDALEPTDYVGIVTFHKDAVVRQELIKVEDKEALKAKVSSFSTNQGVGGTSYSEGLSTAYSMLRDFTDARSKHVIFLSDGAPTDTNYSGIPTSMKNHGMTLSTISLLADNNAKNIMSKLATTGGGNYYSIDKNEDLEILVNIMEDLTLKAKEPKFINTDPFIPKVSGQETGVLAGIEDISQIVMGGYIGSTLKADAVMALYNDDFRPIIAERAWGKGKVTTFMTDIGGEWCTELFANETGLLLLSNLVAQSLNDEILATSITVTPNQQDREAHLRVETSLKMPEQTLEVIVHTRDENGDLNLLETDPTVSQIGFDSFRVAFRTEDPNKVYYIELRILDEFGAVQDSTKLAYTGGMIKEYDLFSESGVNLLSSVAAVTKGELFETVEQIYNVNPPDADMLVYRGLVPCAIALIVFMLLDIFMRIMNFTRKPKEKHQ